MAADELTCRELMRRAVSGDVDAFGRLALARQDDLYRLALSAGLMTDDAAEAVQEALSRAWHRRGKWRPDGNVVAWLRGIALNVAREFRRRRTPRPGLDVASLCAGEEAAVESSEDLRLLAQALDGLPPRQREAVACRFLRQMSVLETDEAMGCAPGTVKAATAAALANLKRALKQA
jgi:RNA polymerase sigma-70 factor (ECF subfamily)